MQVSQLEEISRKGVCALACVRARVCERASERACARALAYDAIFEVIRTARMQVSESVKLICPVTVMWRLPTIKVCRGGENDNQYCETDEFCGSGFCLFMPMNTVLQVSTNGGQLYSGPSTSSILFYMQPQIQTIFPFWESPDFSLR